MLININELVSMSVYTRLWSLLEEFETDGTTAMSENSSDICTLPVEEHYWVQLFSTYIYPI